MSSVPDIGGFRNTTIFLKSVNDNIIIFNERENFMTVLDQIHTGKRPAPPRLLVYGVEGVGKSSYAAGAPRPTRNCAGTSPTICSSHRDHAASCGFSPLTKNIKATCVV